ncbi:MULTISPECIES: hypothetical protein [unclassified Streptomyces]|uniref:hypothetical protein n=1 Tax=unclassified Streptomyces TaxID=2593676 RepID=UPI002E15836C|nr:MULTISPECIES: hypothetical protein [unclassified Streptomyces]WSR29049.1 hypothetical protein OG573_41410 [Streptomyces sp. NBC_01205]
MGATEPNATSEYLMATSADSLDLLDAIAAEMVELFSITRGEAVARINAQWCGIDLSQENELILHEDGYYWGLSIYFGGEVADWSPTADRSGWTTRPAPPAGSKFWTV